VFPSSTRGLVPPVTSTFALSSPSPVDEIGDIANRVSRSATRLMSRWFSAFISSLMAGLSRITMPSDSLVVDVEASDCCETIGSDDVILELILTKSDTAVVADLVLLLLASRWNMIFGTKINMSKELASTKMILQDMREGKRQDKRHVRSPLS
jgi:hypothetical protein